MEENNLLERNSLLSNNLLIVDSSDIWTFAFKYSFNLSDSYNLSSFPSLSDTMSNFNCLLSKLLIFSITLLVSFSTSKFCPSKFFPVITTFLFSAFFLTNPLLGISLGWFGFWKLKLFGRGLLSSSNFVSSIE